jgi:hypothetical protein
LKGELALREISRDPASYRKAADPIPPGSAASMEGAQP